MPKFLDRKNDAQLEQALGAIVAYPTLEQASEHLERLGYHVSPEHLDVLRRNNQARYERARIEQAAKLEEQAALDWMNGARYANQVVDLAIARTEELLRAGRVSDPARVARDLQQVATQKMDKVFASQGRPQKIVEHRDHTEILRQLQAMGVAQVVEGTAREIEPGDG